MSDGACGLQVAHHPQDGLSAARFPPHPIVGRDLGACMGRAVVRGIHTPSHRVGP